LSDLAESILTPPLVRTNVEAIIRTLEDHHARGVPITAKLAQAVPIICGRLMNQKSLRMQVTGAKLVLIALKHNLSLYEFADKAMRLDNGSPTRIVEHAETQRAMQTPDAIRAAIDYDRAMRKVVVNAAPQHVAANTNGSVNGHAPNP